MLDTDLSFCWAVGTNVASGDHRPDSLSSATELLEDRCIPKI